MIVKVLDGEEIDLNLQKFLFDENKKCKSKFQYNIGLDLLSEHPNDLVFQEVYIKKENLILDFFIPSLGLVVECDGKQHTEYVPFFHHTKIEFHKQQIRDQRKRDWCILNNFKMIEVYVK